MFADILPCIPQMIPKRAEKLSTFRLVRSNILLSAQRRVNEGAQRKEHGEEKCDSDRNMYYFSFGLRSVSPVRARARHR